MRKSLLLCICGRGEISRQTVPRLNGVKSAYIGYSLRWPRACTRGTRPFHCARQATPMRTLGLLLVGCLILVPASAAQEPYRSQVTLNAKPEAVSVNLQRTAVIVVDMQNDFAANQDHLSEDGIPT